MKIGVIGSGSWGMTLAMQLLKNNNDVSVWFFDKSQYDEATTTHELKDFLPGISLPIELEFTMDLETAVRGKDVILLAVPSHVVRLTSGKIKPFVGRDTILVNVAKGIENDSLLRMSQVIQEVMGDANDRRICTLSGPTHAEEVSKGMPSTIVAGASNIDTAEKIQKIFFSDTLRVYTNTDIIGVELGGSLKNVIAISAGVLAGMGFGDNTLAALLTRGLFEITRLGVLLGAKEDTFAGLSGMGDLIVTCLSEHSRNRHVGFELGKGRKLEEILSEMKMVAEGVKTAKSVHQLGQKMQIELPISEQIYQVLFEGRSAKEAVITLMGRDPVEERHSIK